MTPSPSSPTRRPPLPAPFGKAANGVVAIVDDAGAIQQIDPVSGEAITIVPGPGNSRPIYSPNGSSLAYLRANGYTAFDLSLGGRTVRDLSSSRRSLYRTWPISVGRPTARAS